MTWASRILRLRRRLGLTQADLAKRLGVTVTAVSNWERGANEPTRATQGTIEMLESEGWKEMKQKRPEGILR